MTKKSSAAGHERLGLMVQKEMELQEILARTWGMQSYDAVPQEDDVIAREEM